MNRIKTTLWVVFLSRLWGIDKVSLDKGINLRNLLDELASTNKIRFDEKIDLVVYGLVKLLLWVDKFIDWKFIRKTLLKALGQALRTIPRPSGPRACPRSLS